MKHSLFGPSSLERRAMCPGSYRMEKDLPEMENEYAKRGTELHAAVAQAINAEQKSEPVELVDGECNASEIEAIKFCYEQYKAVFYEPMRTFFMHTEKEFNFKEILPEVEIGTTDLIIYEPYKIAHVFDWKFNFLPVEPADNNIQLGVYALGAFTEYDVQTVYVHVVEAFNKRMTTYQYVLNEQQNIIDFVNLTVKNCFKAFAALRPSKKACQYCRASLTCPAILAILAEKEEPDKPFSSMSVEELSKMLEIWEINETVSGKGKQYAYAVMLQGLKIPKWYLKEGIKRRSWKDGVTEEQLIQVGKLLNKEIDGLVNRALISVAQLEEKWGKSTLVKDQLKDFIESKAGNPILKKEK